LDDCQYEAAANLVLAEFPGSVITTSEVVADYNYYLAYFDASDDLFYGQDFLLFHGFDGHYAGAITPINDSLTQNPTTGVLTAAPIASAIPLQQQITTAANSGGVEVVMGGGQGANFVGHMVIITAATSSGLTMINDGYVWNYTWAQWFQTYGPANGFTAVWYYAVTWGN
jgi:hypothetical protein